MFIYKILLFELSQGWKKKKCCFLQMCSSWLQCKIVERVADFYFIFHKYLFLCLLQGHYYSCNFAIQIIRPANLIRILHPVVLKPYKFFCCLDTTWIQIIMHSDSTKPSNKVVQIAFEWIWYDFPIIFYAFCKLL